MKDQLRGVKPIQDGSMCHIDCPFPPPHTFLPVCYAKRAIYCIPSPEEQFLSIQCRCYLVLWHTGSVLDSVSQSCDVVLVRRAISSGKPQGVRILEWGGNGEGMEMGRSVYKQPGTKVDRILSQQGGFQVSKGKRKGGKKGWEKGKAEVRGSRHICVVHSIFMYIVIACNCLNDCQSVYVCIIIARYKCNW